MKSLELIFMAIASLFLVTGCSVGSSSNNANTDEQWKHEIPKITSVVDDKDSLVVSVVNPYRTDFVVEARSSHYGSTARVELLEQGVYKIRFRQIAGDIILWSGEWEGGPKDNALGGDAVQRIRLYSAQEVVRTNDVLIVAEMDMEQLPQKGYVFVFLNKHRHKFESVLAKFIPQDDKEELDNRSSPIIAPLGLKRVKGTNIP